MNPEEVEYRRRRFGRRTRVVAVTVLVLLVAGGVGVLTWATIDARNRVSDLEQQTSDLKRQTANIDSRTARVAEVVALAIDLDRRETSDHGRLAGLEGEVSVLEQCVNQGFTNIKLSINGFVYLPYC